MMCVFLLNVIQDYVMQIYPIYFYLLYNQVTDRFSVVNYNRCKNKKAVRVKVIETFCEVKGY